MVIAPFNNKNLFNFAIQSEIVRILKTYTYIIGHYNPSVRIIDLVSHTTYVVCVLILYINGGTYSLKSTPNDWFFEKLFTAILFTLRVFARNTFRISFWCLAWDMNPGFSSNKSTHYLLDHGDFRKQHSYPFLDTPVKVALANPSLTFFIF